MEQSKIFLLQGVVMEDLKLCQARAITWQSKSVLISQTSDLPHPFTSTQVPPDPPSLAMSPDSDSHPCPGVGALCGRPCSWVLKAAITMRCLLHLELLPSIMASLVTPAHPGPCGSAHDARRHGGDCRGGWCAPRGQGSSQSSFAAWRGLRRFHPCALPPPLPAAAQ